MTMTYQMKDVCRIVDIPMHQAQYWTRLGVVTADFTKRTEQGKARLFSLKNLFEFSFVHELASKEIEVSHTKPILDQIPKDFLEAMEKNPNELLTYRLLYDPLLIYYGKGSDGGFFFTTQLEISTKGEKARFWFDQPPPSQLIKDVNAVKGFDRVGVILQYYPSAIMVNLETVRRKLLERLKAGK